MNILEIFKPKWKRSEPIQRAEGVLKLYEVDTLIDIADKDPDEKVRKSAASRIIGLVVTMQDLKKLKDLANNNDDLDVSVAATKRLVELGRGLLAIAQGAKHNSSRAIAIEALSKNDREKLSFSKLSDQSDIETFALNSESPAGLSMALTKLKETGSLSDEFLGQVMLNNALSYESRKKAFDSNDVVTFGETLEDILDAAKNGIGGALLTAASLANDDQSTLREEFLQHVRTLNTELDPDKASLKSMMINILYSDDEYKAFVRTEFKAGEPSGEVIGKTVSKLRTLNAESERAYRQSLSQGSLVWDKSKLYLDLQKELMRNARASSWVLAASYEPELSVQLGSDVAKFCREALEMQPSMQHWISQRL